MGKVAAKADDRQSQGVEANSDFKFQIGKTRLDHRSELAKGFTQGA